MAYPSDNRPAGSADSRAARGQRSPVSPDEDATSVFDSSGYARPARGGAAPRSRASVPRSRPRTAAPPIRLSPLAIFAVVSSVLVVVLAVVLIAVLASRKDAAPAPAPTQSGTAVLTQPPIPYQEPPSTATVIVTPSPEPLPVTIQTPSPAPASTPAPTAAPVTADPGRTYTSAGVLADAQAAAERDSHYSTVSEKDVELEVPADSAFLRTPFVKKVYAGEEGKAIYIMPKPIPGNGTLGTVAHGEQVTVLAENPYYYFFVTRDGRAGWNGKSFFKDP